MSKDSKEQIQLKHKPDWQWLGRSLTSYIAQHPKAVGAKTLTQARKLAFGMKKGNKK